MYLFATMMTCAVLGIWAYGKESKTGHSPYGLFGLGCTVLFFVALFSYLTQEE